jgi:hypothetical protein
LGIWYPGTTRNALTTGVVRLPEDLASVSMNSSGQTAYPWDLVVAITRVLLREGLFRLQTEIRSSNDLHRGAAFGDLPMVFDHQVGYRTVIVAASFVCCRSYDAPRQFQFAYANGCKQQALRH